MRFCLRVAGIRTQIQLPAEIRSPSLPPGYEAFICDGLGTDAHLTIRAFPRPSPSALPFVDPDGADLREAQAYPILRYTRAGERFQHRRDGELVLVTPTHLIVFQPAGNRMEVFLFDGVDLAHQLAGYMFHLLGCVLAARKGLLLHGAGFVMAGAAGVVIGPSGAGKSTAVELLGYDFLLSDDMVAVAELDGAPILHATPFGGPSDGARSGSLRALFFVRKASSFVLERIAPRAALQRYLSEHGEYISQLFQPYVALAFRSAHAMFERVPAYELCFSPEYIDRQEILRVLSMPLS
jgi:hypothetical protein